MTKSDSISTGIGSHRKRLEQRRIVAAQAVIEGQWLVALGAIKDCIGHEEVIRELEYQSECMEVEQC